MLGTVRWNWWWCPIGCKTAWTACRASRRTKGTGWPQVSELLRVYCLSGGQNPNVSQSLHSVLPELRPVHLLRTGIRLQFCQHQQGRLWSHLLVLWRGVQFAGLRQVCNGVTTVAVGFTSRVNIGIPPWLLSRCCLIFTDFIQTRDQPKAADRAPPWHSSSGHTTQPRFNMLHTSLLSDTRTA